MSERDTASKAAAVMSTAAAVAAALAFIKSGKAQAAAPGTVPGSVIPEELMTLIIAIANNVDHIDTEVLQSILTAISTMAIQVRGWPPNVAGVRTFVIVCAVVNRAYEASDMLIPDGMSLVIKASPLNAVGSLIFVAKSPAESTNPNSAWPLVPNEPIAYQVKNADAFHVSTNVANSVALFTAEQRN